MRKCLSFVTVLCLAGPASATEWNVLGARATAMGGAAVALPNGAESAYWNPAGLGEPDNTSGVQIPVGAHLGLSGSVLQGAKDFNQVSKDCGGSGNIANCTPANIQNAASEMNAPGNGVRGDVGTGLGFKAGRVAFFANDFAYVGGKPFVDTANLTPGTVQNNQSALILRGLNVTEFGAGYGRELGFAPGLFAGVTAKLLMGKVGYDQLNVITNDPGGNGGLSNFTKNARSSVQPGVDAGMLWDVNRTLESAWWRPRLGLTARNINNPKFKNPDAAVAAGAPSRYSLQGGLRAGVALTPLGFWNIAADADLTRNLTALEGVKSQTVGVGTEINVFNRSWINIPLRAGLSKNVALAGSKTALSAGAGFNFLHLNVDLGASMTPGTQTIQSQDKSQKLPAELGVSGQIALLFGGPSSLKAQESEQGAGKPISK